MKSPLWRIIHSKAVEVDRGTAHRAKIGVTAPTYSPSPIAGITVGTMTTTKHRIYTTPFAAVYPHYVTKAENKGRTKAEVDEIIRWLTGYTQKRLETQIEKETDFETFFDKAPELNPDRRLITGVVCGVRVEDIEEPTMQEIRYLDKLVDELARGKPMEKILRTP